MQIQITDFGDFIKILMDEQEVLFHKNITEFLQDGDVFIFRDGKTEKHFNYEFITVPTEQNKEELIATIKSFLPAEHLDTFKELGDSITGGGDSEFENLIVNQSLTGGGIASPNNLTYLSLGGDYPGLGILLPLYLANINRSILEYLYCANNGLTSLPSLAGLTALHTLYCLNNQLTSLPSLSGLTAFQNLDCSYNLMPATAVDNAIIDLSNLVDESEITDGYFDISGTGNAAPTGASADALENLIDNHLWTILTN